MWNKFHLYLVLITYLIGVGSSIHYFGKWLSGFIGFEFGQLLVLIVQIVAFYSLTKVEKNIKQDAVSEYISRSNREL